MRYIIEGLAGLSWIAGVILLFSAITLVGVQAAFNVQLAIAFFLCGLFLLVYQNRGTE